MLDVFIFILGLIIGSFLNVCIYRIPREESIVFPSSHCINCGTRIKWYDLFPVLSYIFLRGKCRHCGEKISIRYPIIETIVGILFLFIYIKYGMSFEFIKYCFLVSFLIVIGMIDFDTMDVYFKTTISGIIIGAIFLFLEWCLYKKGIIYNFDFYSYVIAAAIGYGFIAGIILLTGGMGWGDAEICLLCGIFLGTRLTIVTLFLSFIVGAISGIILILFKKKTKKDYIPFGPSIAMAGIITIFVGEELANWYLGLF